MYPIQDYEIYDIETIKNKALLLEPSKHGFTFVIDDEREDLDDSTIYNTLLKTKMFRSIEIKKRWVQLWISELNGTYFLIENDIRLKNIGDQFYKLMHPTDSKLIKHIAMILNPNKELDNEELKNYIFDLSIKYFAPLGVDKNNYELNDNRIEFYFPIKKPFFISVGTFSNSKTDRKIHCSFRLKAESEEIFVAVSFAFSSEEEFQQNALKLINRTKMEIEKALKTRTPEELRLINRENFFMRSQTW